MARKALADVLVRKRKDITGDVTLNDEDLLQFQANLNSYQSQSIGYCDGELGNRAREAWDYYYKRLPLPMVEGSSKQVMPVVWNTVNGVLGELTSTFTSGDDVVKFAPLGPEDGLGAIAATKIVNKIVLHENDGFSVLHDAFKECLVTRNSFVKIWWDEMTHLCREEFEDLTKDELDIYLSSIGAKDDILETEIEEMPSIKYDESGKETEVKSLKGEKKPSKKDVRYRGRVLYNKKKEGVKIAYVPFEEVTIEPTARCLKEANYLGHRTRKTKDELKQLGFDPEVVDKLPSNSTEALMGATDNARVNYLNPLDTSQNLEVGDNETDKIWLVENYFRSSIPSGRSELYQVFTINGQILEINHAQKIPFVTFTPYPIPGSIWGESVYEVTKDLQDLGSTTLRGIIDNVLNANFRKYIAIKNGYNRESLLNNRPGSIVEVNVAGAVDIFPYHPLPQGMDTLLAYVNEQKEERTGVSKIGQGLDSSVFKNDNSTATTQMVMTEALNRVRMVARNIANSGMSELMLHVYELIRHRGKEPIVVESSQGMLEVDPKQLPERTKLTVNTAIGRAEKAEQANKLTGLVQIFTQVPQMGAFLQSNGAYYLATQIFEAAGIMDVENYLTPPDQLPPPEPNPVEELQIQLLGAQVEGQQIENQKNVAEVTLAQQKQEFEQQKAADEMDIKRNESNSRQDQMADEMALQIRKVQNSEKETELGFRKLDFEEKRLLIEAQVEVQQKRGVNLTN